jgi:hypothetical protein
MKSVENEVPRTFLSEPSMLAVVINVMPSGSLDPSFSKIAKSKGGDEFVAWPFFQASNVSYVLEP